MTDLAAIAERHVEDTNVRLFIGDGSVHVGTCAEDRQSWPCDAARLLALLADTPSVEPPAVSHEATSTTGRANSGGGRDADIARIAAVLEVAWPKHVESSGGTGDYDTTNWYVNDPALPSDALAAALYDAGLRPSVEPAGLDVEKVHRILCGRLVDHEAGSRVPHTWPCARFATDYAALPTQASDSPEKP